MTAHYELLGGSLKLEAAETGYRGGIDPILLASLAKGQGKIMDLGCGIGTAGLAVATRCPEIELSLLDISSRNIDFTKRKSMTIDSLWYLSVLWFQIQMKNYLENVFEKHLISK